MTTQELLKDAMLLNTKYYSRLNNGQLLLGDELKMQLQIHTMLIHLLESLTLSERVKHSHIDAVEFMQKDMPNWLLKSESLNPLDSDEVIEL